MIQVTALHSSDHLFDFPSISEAAIKRPINGRHDNGGLGMWITIDLGHWSAGNFGKHVYEVKFEVEPDEIAVIDLGELSNLGRYERIDFNQHRLALLDKGTRFTKILEGAGFVQGILHDLTAISSFRKIN
jgi:hypothetical protein